MMSSDDFWVGLKTHENRKIETLLFLFVLNTLCCLLAVLSLFRVLKLQQLLRSYLICPHTKSLRTIGDICTYFYTRLALQKNEQKIVGAPVSSVASAILISNKLVKLLLFTKQLICFFFAFLFKSHIFFVGNYCWGKRCSLTTFKSWCNNDNDTDTDNNRFRQFLLVQQISPDGI